MVVLWGLREAPGGTRRLLWGFLKETSHGLLGYNQASKVTLVPFPFPFTQMRYLRSEILFIFFCWPGLPVRWCLNPR